MPVALSSSKAPEKPAVVLVHGLWMPGWDMYLLAKRLEGCGFRVYRFTYRSVRHGLRENAFRLNHFLTSVTGGTVHLVGHSLGGLVIRRLFLDYPKQRPGRIVTLGTPHRPCRIALRLSGPLGRRLLGRSHPALTEPLPAWRGDRPLGSIAGRLPLGFGRLLRCLPEPNDGTVAVDETIVPGITERIILPVSHMGMLVAPGVAREVCAFLNTGHFSTAAAPVQGATQ